MRRLMIVYNPRSSKFLRVKTEVLDYARELPGFLVGKFEVQPTNIMDNARKLSQILENNDLVVAAGGDGTATICLNAAMLAEKDVELGVLPYGNFNDIVGTLKTQNLQQVLEGKVRKVWPLEVLVDEKRWRFAFGYVTLGLFAESCAVFDEKQMRKSLRKGNKTAVFSWVKLAEWYFKNRKKRDFLPAKSLNGEELKKGTTDFVVVNGRKMAGVMRGGDWFLDEKKFLSANAGLKSFWSLGVLMAKSILKQVPGEEVIDAQVLEFGENSEVEIQAEGEYERLKNVKKVEIRKAKKCLKMLSNT